MYSSAFYLQKRNRLWRKTRSPTYKPLCKGTDGNRNWPYEWGGMGPKLHYVIHICFAERYNIERNSETKLIYRLLNFMKVLTTLLSLLE